MITILLRYGRHFEACIGQRAAGVVVEYPRMLFEGVSKPQSASGEEL